MMVINTAADFQPVVFLFFCNKIPLPPRILCSFIKQNVNIHIVEMFLFENQELNTVVHLYI